MSGFEVRNFDVEETLKELGKLLKKIMPSGWGFTLMMFDYSKGGKDAGSMFYISSAQRDDMIKAMMEFVDKQTEEQVKN